MSRGKLIFLLVLAAVVVAAFWGVHRVVNSWRGDDDIQTVRTSNGVKIKVRVPKGETPRNDKSTPLSPRVEKINVTTVEAAKPPPAPTVTQKGFEYLRSGNIPDAKDFFLEHVTLHPIDPQGHFGLGVVYRTEEDFVQSVEEFSKTILLDSSHAEAKFQLAEMLTFQTKDNFESAEELYKEVLAQVPEEKAALNGLASVYLATGRVDEAIQSWEDLRKDLPAQAPIAKNLSEAYLVKAHLEEQAGNTEAANNWTAKAKEINPQPLPSPEQPTEASQ